MYTWFIVRLIFRPLVIAKFLESVMFWESIFVHGNYIIYMGMGLATWEWELHGNGNNGSPAPPQNFDLPPPSEDRFSVPAAGPAIRIHVTPSSPRG